MSEIDTAVAALPLDPQAEELARKKTAELESTQKSVADTEMAINSLQSEVAVLEHRLKECAKTEEKISAVRQRITELNAELAEWRYIQQGCGKDGLQALEIDGTAPMIAQHANELLTATFGPGVTVGFRTLDEDGKECFDIVVYRDGDEDYKGTLLKNLCGGEEVWILKALRLALTLVAKQKSGRDIATALSDEEDGALDESNAINFIALYRALMTTGGFDACLYITHRDACKQMADHIIQFTDNGVRIASNSVATKAA